MDYYRLCDDYEQIAEKALTTPANTEQLMELKAYIEKVESDIIFKMEKRLYQSQERLAFLSDFAQFSPAEIRLNANVFMWHGRMPAIFEEHKLIVSEKRSQYEDTLKVMICITFNNTVKPVLSDHSKLDKTKLFMTNDSLMKVALSNNGS